MIHTVFLHGIDKRTNVLVDLDKNKEGLSSLLSGIGFLERTREAELLMVPSEFLMSELKCMQGRENEPTDPYTEEDG